MHHRDISGYQALGARPFARVTFAAGNRVPAILAKEVYAVAAIVAATIQVFAQINGWSIGLTPWFAAGVCFVIRSLAVRYSWGLPVVGRP
jgi:uncharacterized membrane protein YeiH